MFLLFLGVGILLWYRLPEKKTETIIPSARPIVSPTQHITSVTPTLLPANKILQNNYHVYQSFNNCGPAALSMTLSYYGHAVSQEDLGRQMRPYQNQLGDNDDKSVTLDELAEESKKYNLVPFHRPAGNINLLKTFIAQGFPVITRTLLTTHEDIGHYRIIKGYDDSTKQLIQDDSLQGSNLSYSYDEFNQLWKYFNYEYLVLVPTEQIAVLKHILGKYIDEKQAWEDAEKNAAEILKVDPSNIAAGFNRAIALYHLGQYSESLNQFEQIENRLPFRTLWYQIEPIQAYMHAGNTDRVLMMTDAILSNQNRAFSELYLLRGNVYEQRGQIDMARTEYEKAIFYNTNLQKARDALNNTYPN